MTHAVINCFGENRISVMNENAVRVVSRNSFAELLNDPLSRRLCGHIDMKQLSTRMFNHHKHIEDTEGRDDCDAEVTRNDALGMIADKVAQRCD